LSWYKKFQFEMDVPYWVVNFSDPKAIKGILKFREYIEKDMWKGSKEAQCLLIDLDTIINSLDLSPIEREILDFYMSGFDNYDFAGNYLSDYYIISKEFSISMDLARKRLNHIIDMIYDKNLFDWYHAYCKKFKEWISLNLDERNKILEEHRKKYIFSEINTKPNFTLNKNEVVDNKFLHDRLNELITLSKLINKNIEKTPEDSEERTKLNKYVISVNKDITSIKKYLNVHRRKKSCKTDYNVKKLNKINKQIKEFANDEDKISELEEERNSLLEEQINGLKFFLYGNTTDNLYGKVLELKNVKEISFADKFIAWRIQNIITEPKRGEKLLTERQRKLFYLYFVKGLKQEKVAIELKCTQQSVSSELNTIVNYIKKLIFNS